jgi:hypothetical protein
VALARALGRDQDHSHDRTGEPDSGGHQDRSLDAVEERARDRFVKGLGQTVLAAGVDLGGRAEGRPIDRSALSAIEPGKCAGSASVRRLA